MLLNSLAIQEQIANQIRQRQTMTVKINISDYATHTITLKCFVLKYINVFSRTNGEYAPSCLLSHKCSS